MAFDDKDLGVVFPTRNGVAIGAAGERAMLDAIGGANQIRTRLTLNPDGSTTLLRTRNGMPEFTTLGTSSAKKGGDVPSIEAARGFIAHVTGASVAALFSPYTLEVINNKFVVVGHSYTVQSFASPYNVPAADSTNWYDVISFYNGAVLVNGKTMPDLGVSGAPTDAFPWFIPRSGNGLARYGDKVTNSYEKRLFAVGRDIVEVLGGGSMALLPIEPRNEGRALTIGPRVEAANNTAWIAQLYYTGATWDGWGEWQFTAAEIAMTATSNYLARTSYALTAGLPNAMLNGVGTSAGTETADVELPETPLWLVGVGELGSQSTNLRNILYPWRRTAGHTLTGTRTGNYSRTTYSGVCEATTVVAGVELQYKAKNDKYWDVRTESCVVAAQTVWVADQSFQSGQTPGASLDATATTLFWGLSTNPNPPVPPVRGHLAWDTGVVAIPGATGLSRNYERQLGEFSVGMVTGNSLVHIKFSRNSSYGADFQFSPVTTYFDTYLANPYGLIGASSGMGIYSNVQLAAAGNPANDMIYVNDTYKQNPNPPPKQTDVVLAEISAEFDRRAALFCAQTCYDNENSSGLTHTNLYTATTVSNVTRDTVTLEWSSCDYLLHDAENGVFITIEGNFYGVDSAATLTVILRIKTRSGEASRTLAVFQYSYVDMLPPKKIHGTSLFAIPSPQIRALFVPLYQEQGTFKGAAYTTAAEEANGAAPVSLFNFVLVLKSYDDLGSCNEDNRSGPAVHYVPCNLLEMLYATVFSTKLGVDDYERYPVDFKERFKEMMETLFNVPRRVVFRDGGFVDWLDTLGDKYVTEETTELYRV